MKYLYFSTCFLIVLVLSEADFGFSQMTTASPNPLVQETYSVAQVTMRLPVRLYWGYLVIVEGSIGNVQKLNFLVDTGAYPSVIDQKIVHNLGLAEQPARVNLSNTRVQASIVDQPSLILGPDLAESLPVLLHVHSFFRMALGPRVIPT